MAANQSDNQKAWKLNNLRDQAFFYWVFHYQLHGWFARPVSKCIMEDQNTQVVEGVQEASSKVVINGEEYDTTEAYELIGKGKLAREYEQKWNSPIDSLASAYGKSQQTVQSMKSELDTARQQLARFEQKKEAGTETEGDVEKAREAARKLGIILKDDLDKDGYIRKDQLDQYLEEREQQRKALEQIMSTADSLEKELDGKDGRPRFVKKHVLAYANAYKIPDLKAAYEDMHSDALQSWKDAQIASQKKPGLKTLNASPGNKEPQEVKVTNDNYNSLLKEKLWGSN